MQRIVGVNYENGEVSGVNIDELNDGQAVLTLKEFIQPIGLMMIHF